MTYTKLMFIVGTIVAVIAAYFRIYPLLVFALFWAIRYGVERAIIASKEEGGFR